MTTQKATSSKTNDSSMSWNLKVMTDTWIGQKFQSLIVSQDDPLVDLRISAAGWKGQFNGQFTDPWGFGHRPSQKSNLNQPPVSMARQKLGYILNTNFAHYFFGAAIIFSVVVVIIQTDADAKGEHVPSWVPMVDIILLLIYTLELIARFYVARGTFFCNGVNNLDFAVVILDWVVEMLKRTHVIAETHASFTYLRIGRLARLTRAYRVLLRLPMLAAMVKSLYGALQAIFWGVILLSVTLTMSSILAVQLIHPIVKDLTDAGAFDQCSRCPRAFATVMNANLTFLQQIVAGDSWGLLTVPIIERQPWTTLLFVPILLFVNLAIMNVILAVIVECADQARMSDLRARTEAREHEFMVKSRALLKVFAVLDEDQSGDISLEEVKKGFETNEDFAMCLRDLGIRGEDLHTVFDIMDVDHSGTVDYKEFVENLHRMQTADEHMLLSFIRHYVVAILRRIQRKDYDLRYDGSHGSHHSSCASHHSHQDISEAPCTPQSVLIRRPDDEKKLSHKISLTTLSTDVAQLHDICDQICQRLDDGVKEINQVSALMSTVQAQGGAALHRGEDNHRPNVVSCTGNHLSPRLHASALPWPLYAQLDQPPDHGCMASSKCTLDKEMLQEPGPIVLMEQVGTVGL